MASYNSPTVMLRKQWENMPFKTPFYINVMNEGIRIWKRPVDDLTPLAKAFILQIKELLKEW